ncbi:OB-fold domain-containing protein [Nocardia sp. BSTN01]|uniref:Zn-ribbon domain-containing OB-fold protein n=1 Tax=Nocardia sp. BSTN01 TaxID=2783665 RepID=UPI001890788B|nr:OB-fold domain-containing protein [Nocardia sp. BSTN01]MBF5001075.1 OB-fold domain-containing protein [Nocardia sp. BSTN01]
MVQHTQTPGDHQSRSGNSLMVRRCRQCDGLHAPTTAECATCRTGNLEWTASSGRGSLVSYRLVHRSMGGPHSEVVPLTIAIVELDEGPRIYATVEGDLPPYSDVPVRVRFEARPKYDRFPVFAIDAAPAHRVRRSPVPPSDRDDPPTECDASWVRSALRQCDLMVRAGLLDPAEKTLVAFAVRWAPFGGSSADELLVAFGTDRRRFLHLVTEALRPRRTDSVVVRHRKQLLHEALTRAWQVGHHPQEAQ